MPRTSSRHADNQIHASNSHPKSVLILGASGRTGIECILALDKKDASIQPKIHAFCRNPAKLPLNVKAVCNSMITGDARKTLDIERALAETKADVVIVSVGNGDNIGKSDVRTASARALVQILELPEFEYVHTIVVSSSGAGSSKINIGMGMGALISYRLRHVLHDHSGQEAAFLQNEAIARRTTIIRPTSLTVKHATHKLIELDDLERPPTIKTDRADLALWVVEEMFSPDNLLRKHRVVNVTGMKQ